MLIRVHTGKDASKKGEKVREILNKNKIGSNLQVYVSLMIVSCPDLYNILTERCL